MCRFVPVWDLVELDVPQVRDLLHVLGILMVPKARILSVAPGFSIVLCRRLSVHLENPTTWSSEEAAQEVDVIDLACTCCSLVRLVNPL